MSSRQYSTSFDDQLADVYRRIHTIEVHAQMVPLHARNQVATDYASISATVPTLAWQYDFPFSSSRVSVIVEAFQTAAVTCALDLYDLNAGVLLAASQPVVATVGTLFTFTSNTLTFNATTGMASMAVRASRASGTFNVRPAWAGNMP